MAMTVLNNTAAMMTMGELNKNITKVGKDLSKISKGERLPNFSHGASDVAISEKMRVKIRGLSQDERNVQNGASLLRTAEGGMKEIVDELRNLKELALNSANDHNTDKDRATMQKVIDQKIQNIEDIAATTNYNGRLLLDGTWKMPFHEITQVAVPHVEYIPYHTVTRKLIGTEDTQVTGDAPSITKIKDPYTGQTTLRQDNSLKNLSQDFKPLYNTCYEGHVTSQGGISCDEGFKWDNKYDMWNDKLGWSWGSDYISKNTQTELQTIKKFNQALNETTLTGTAALDEAINIATNGAFATMNDLATQFMNDLTASNNSSNFLKQYCGIDLYNTDTGSITGFDAGGKTIKTDKSVVPEYTDIETWGMPTPGSSTKFSGLTVHWPTQGVNTGFSPAETAILKGLNSEWAQNCLDLIQESFGLNFNDPNATPKEISVQFVNVDDDSLAYVSYGVDTGDGKAKDLILNVNMKYYNNIYRDSPDGATSTAGAGYLDRTLAHEFTHAAMAANIDYFNDLPLFIQEGMAELVHGIDDERGNTIRSLASSNGIQYMDYMLNGTDVSDPSRTGEEIEKFKAQVPYAGGYMFLRYMAEKGTTLSTVPQRSNQVAVDMDFSSFANETIPDAFHKQGFAILCAGCYQYINITFDKDLATEDSTFTRSTNDRQKSDYVIGIKNVSTVAGIEEAIFRGVSATNLTDRQNGHSDALDISRKVSDGNGGETTEYLNVVLDGYHGVRMAKNPDGDGYVILKNQDDPDIGILDSGVILAVEAENTGDDLPPGTIDKDGNEVIPLTGPTDINITTPQYDVVDTTAYHKVVSYTYEEEEVLREGNPLYIQTGTKANQNLALFINDMRPAAMGIDKFNVTTRPKASDSLDVVDNAIQYALDEITRIGAYQSRLEFTHDNLVTANENTQAAESTIRDADIAKEMTSFTKNNVLAQASQAMLSQANQNASGVLSLLQ